MPKYAFQCRECGIVEDVEADTGSDAEIPEHCGEPMRRLWATAFQLRGAGWASHEYGREEND